MQGIAMSLVNWSLQKSHSQLSNLAHAQCISNIPTKLFVCVYIPLNIGF